MRWNRWACDWSFSLFNATALYAMKTLGHLPHCLLVINHLLLQVASLASLAQLLPPRSPTVSNPAPDSSLCRAAAPRLRPLASASAAARRLRPLRISYCALARLHPLQLLLPICVRFQLLLPDCAHFSCCSRSRPLRMLLPDCSTAAPRLHASACSPSWIPAQCSRTFFVVQ